MAMIAEQQRLLEAEARSAHWRRWGPYLSERQWGTVREDYSPGGTAWDYFPHDHARSRAYRWGEDGLGAISDNHQRLCFALALWNGRDPILKERLFGLTGPQGNHGEDVKEYYFYLDSTPTHSYMKFLYKYPHAVLLGYPQATLPTMRQNFYWAKCNIQGKPTYVLTHILAASDGAARAVVQRQYYVSTGYNAEQAVASFLPVQEGTIVVSASHAFTDQVAGFGGSF